MDIIIIIINLFFVDVEIVINWQIKKKKSQLNADLYLSSINIATEATLHS